MKEVLIPQSIKAREYCINLLDVKCELEKANRIERLNLEGITPKTKPEKVLKAKKVQPIQNESETVTHTARFISDLEGFRTVAYWDAKQWSVCYGTKSFKGEVVSENECMNRLLARVKSELNRIEKNGGSSLSQNKKIALVSFFYNVGYKQNVLNFAIRGDDSSVIYLMNKYVYSEGKRSRGLVKRRGLEIKKYTS